MNPSATSIRLVLHGCCGPCLLEPYDALRAVGTEVVVAYFNPNIHPIGEYEKRRDTLLAYAAEAGIEVVEIAYDPAEWLTSVGPHAHSRAQRCRLCYRIRLSRVARWAAEHDFDAIATTLTVSPYQDAAAIAQEGERAARKAGITYVDRDYRDRYREATRRSRGMGMYRQNYCGCLMSEIEARDERAARKVAREASRGEV